MPQKTTHIDTKHAQRNRSWKLLDGKNAILGRLASKAAVLLRGKHKRFFTPSVDCGDFVVVANAAGVRRTGKKADTHGYFSHSGYAGGAKVIPYKLQMERDPRKVVELAVKRMLPDTRLRRHQMRRLKIFKGEPAKITLKLEAVSV